MSKFSDTFGKPRFSHSVPSNISFEKVNFFISVYRLKDPRLPEHEEGQPLLPQHLMHEEPAKKMGTKFGMLGLRSEIRMDTSLL